MTPLTNCYLDYPQAATGEPHGWGNVIALQTVYGLQPVPASLPADKVRHILGAGANLWTELVPNYARVQYMVYPRACALAEVTWSDPKLKNWTDFRNRLDVHLQRLRAQGVNYRQPRAEDNAAGE